MTAAAAGHASGADLALLRELAADATEILVVDDVDLVPAIRAGLAPACAGGSLSIAAAPSAARAGLLTIARLTCHLLLSPHRFQRKSPRSRDSEECIGRKADRLPATPHANGVGRWAGSSSSGAGSTPVALGWNGMSSSATPGPAGAGAKSAVSAGTSL